ncbi:MAG: histidinol phosphate phosphatase domain-containing protein [Patescibacteria group bacterium]
MLHDFHTHTCLSDGALSPCELIRRAAVAGYACIALTDHTGRGSLARILAELRADCDLARAHWGLRALAGVELTHVPPQAIPALAREARELGAEIVVVHGESPVEPVAAGTNRAAVSCRDVDILAHPGLLTAEEAALAAANGVFLELSARGGHNMANGLVASLARAAGARLLVDSDAHAPADLLTTAKAKMVALGAGLTAEESDGCLETSPGILLDRLSGCSSV